MSDQRSPSGPGASVDTLENLRNTNDELGELLQTDGGNDDNSDELPKDTPSASTANDGIEDISEPSEIESSEIESSNEDPVNDTHDEAGDAPISNDNKGNKGNLDNGTKDPESESRGLKEKFIDVLGVGEDHLRPEEQVKGITDEAVEDLTPEDLVEATESFSSDVSRYDSKRTELEADIQAQIQANETVIAEEAEKVAEHLKKAHDLASEDIAHPYDFNPERGSKALGTTLENTIRGDKIVIPEDRYDFDISDEGLATYLAKVSEQGDDAMEMFSKLQEDMESLREARDQKKKELEDLRSRNEDQLDSSRSRFTTEDEEERAEAIKDVEDTADYAEFEREVSEIDRELSGKRPRKEQHLAVGNTLLEEARTAYSSQASETEEYANTVSEELGHLTNALENLTSAEIGEMDEMLSEYLEDHGDLFEGSGKHHSDAEGMLREGHQKVVSALGVKAAQQYAQGQKAVDELEYLENVLEERTDRISAERSMTVQDIIDESYDGEDFESYLDEQMSQVLDDDYSARDDIRNIFKGLEAMRDEAN